LAQAANKFAPGDRVVSAKRSLPEQNKKRRIGGAYRITVSVTYHIIFTRFASIIASRSPYVRFIIRRFLGVCKIYFVALLFGAD
jgi:hypothetical protein